LWLKTRRLVKGQLPILGIIVAIMKYFSKFNLLIKQEHRELAREAVRKSLVLLKNGNSSNQPFLPLPKKATKILVAGTHADNLGYQCGGWTIQWQGDSGNITVGKLINLIYCTGISHQMTNLL
jgi:beta-glucosidase-like glycosyl hydrolase